MVGNHLSHYKILSELGRGGMGIVYKGEDTKLHRTVAIKVLPAAALSNEDDRARFYREARAAASLSHPNIAVIHEIDEAVPEGSKDDDQRPFIAMEYIEGETLEDRIKQGPMKLEEAVRIASEIAGGLDAAHKKDIVHRDIKAANVMLDGEGRAKILDFGLAQTAQSTKLTRMGSTLGTVAYMSPEQARGEEVDARTDLWALGVTLYEMIAGTHPFGGDYEQAVVYSILNSDPEPLTAIRTGVPMELERITGKCMAKQATSRYQGATDLIVDLENVDIRTAMTSSLSNTQLAPVSKRGLAFPLPLQFAAVAIIAALMTFWATRISGPTEDLAGSQLIKIKMKLEGFDDAQFPRLTPDGRYLIFSADDSSGSGVFRYDFEDESVERFTSRNEDHLGVSNPSGTAYLGMVLNETRDGRDRMYVKNIPGGREREVSGSLERGMNWYNDTSVFVQGGDPRSAFIHDLYSGQEAFLFEVDSTMAGSGGLFTSDVNTRGEVLISHEFEDGSAPLLYLVDPANGHSELVMEGAMNALFITDNSFIYSQEEDGEYFLSFLDAANKATGDDRQILGPTIHQFLFVTSVGDILFFSATEFEAYLDNTGEDGMIRSSVRIPNDLHWSDVNPAASHLVISSGTDETYTASNLDLIDLGTGETTPILDSDRLIYFSRFSDDGSVIFFSELQDGENWKTMSVAADGKGGVTAVVDGANYHQSSDGNWAAYQRAGSSPTDVDIVVRNLVTGTDEVFEPNLNTGYLASVFGFSHDNKFLIFRSGNSRKALELSTNQLFDLPSWDAQWADHEAALYGIHDGWMKRVHYSDVNGFHLLEEEFLYEVNNDVVMNAATGSGIFVNRTVDLDSSLEINWWQNFAASLERDQ